MNQTDTQVSPGANGSSTAQDLFALTDEQILEIEPEAQDVEVDAASEISNAATAAQQPPTANHKSEVSSQDAEPPGWLAAQMKDPWTGREAQELWNGIQQAKSEAAAYRAAFATPEDAHALKELYAGGANEARAIAERARLLDDIDRSYFGAAGNSAEQTSAARIQLAQSLLHEDPAAFREMVFAGLRALEETEKGSSVSSTAGLPRLAQVANRAATIATPGTSPTFSPSAQNQSPRDSQAQQASPHESPLTSHESQISAYAAFEKAANEDLERSVGASIARTIEHALPNLKGSNEASATGARNGVPLQERLVGAVRQDVEAALKGDRQLGEQIAQILSARRFDNETRAQVVRLIGERAQQLIPAAAKRVLNEWTQATLTAHRGSAARAEAASSRREVTPASGQARRGLASSKTGRAASPGRSDAPRASLGRVDYRKLSDEQILDM